MAPTHFFRKILLLVLISSALGFFVMPAQAAQFKPEIKYAQVGEVKLAYYTRGKGEPMLMIMGYAGSMSLWDPALVEELAKTNLLIMFDNRGIGLSTDSKENHTTIPQMADDAAGLAKALGYKKVNVLAWSMGARIGQQLLIRHPDLISKAILCAPDPGGSHSVHMEPSVAATFNDPKLTFLENVELLFTNDAAGKQAAKESLTRIHAAAKNGSAPNDFNVPQETKDRQIIARTKLWSADESNYENLKNIKVPVLVADGRYDIIDRPENSKIIASQIPFAWLAFFDGGHAFLSQQYKKFADTVKVFLQK